MTAILTATLLEEAVADRPDWTIPKPTLALRTVFRTGKSFTEERWVVFEVAVGHRPGDSAFYVVMRRLATRSGWSQHTSTVVGRESRPTVAEALELADGLLAAALEHDKGGTA